MAEFLSFIFVYLILIAPGILFLYAVCKALYEGCMKWLAFAVVVLLSYPAYIFGFMLITKSLTEG